MVLLGRAGVSEDQEGARGALCGARRDGGEVGRRDRGHWLNHIEGQTTARHWWVTITCITSRNYVAVRSG
jgi:hypothetical protein